MNGHEIFYYPYASFKEEQKPLLKAAALYFDKLYILDPLKASSGTIGPGGASKDVRLLEDIGVLDRVGPGQVLFKYEKPIADAIRADLNDPEFMKLCETSGRAQYWTLALAKVPKIIRDDPEFKPLDRSMQHLMGDVAREVLPDVSRYAEHFAEVYDEYIENDSGMVEYRYADYPLPLGEAIMINHALFGGLLYTGAMPLTDDPFHNKVLALKIQRAQNIPKVREILEDRAKTRKMKSNQLAMTTMTDIDLAIISPDIPMEDILKYRLDHKDALDKARQELGWMAREISQNPWSKEFADELESNTIPKIRRKLEESKKARDSWLKSGRGKKALKMVGMTVAAATATISLALSATPLLPVAVVIGILGLVSDVAIPGGELALDWKRGKREALGNGLHYLLNIKRG